MIKFLPLSLLIFSCATNETDYAENNNSDSVILDADMHKVKFGELTVDTLEYSKFNMDSMLDIHKNDILFMNYWIDFSFEEFQFISYYNFKNGDLFEFGKDGYPSNTCTGKNNTLEPELGTYLTFEGLDYPFSVDRSFNQKTDCSEISLNIKECNVPAGGSLKIVADNYEKKYGNKKGVWDGILNGNKWIHINLDEEYKFLTITYACAFHMQIEQERLDSANNAFIDHLKNEEKKKQEKDEKTLNNI